MTNALVTINGARPGLLYNQNLLGQWFADDTSNAFPWFSVYDNPPAPDPISYAHGMRQRVFPAGTNTVFLIQSARPEQMPPGAALLINNGGKNPCFLSTKTDGSQRVPLAAGVVMLYQWQNGAWQVDTNPVTPLPPQNVKIIAP